MTPSPRLERKTLAMENVVRPKTAPAAIWSISLSLIREAGFLYKHSLPSHPLPDGKSSDVGGGDPF